MKSDNVSPSEWRWVAFFSGFLVTLTLLPYAWALAASSEYQFMGILSNPKDGATYLSKIQQGLDGNWLFELRHTPQVHDPAGFHLFYLFLGQVANLLGVSPVLIFHLARVATSVFMFFALYELGASIWHRPRPRRLFFLFISAGSGLGWLGLIFNQNQFAPDLIVPEAFPFFAAYTNPHFPLAIGCLALMTAHLITVFRPGYAEPPTPDNGAILVLTLSVVLALVSPPAIIVIGSALVGYILVRMWKTRTIAWHEIRWSSLAILPASPFAAYYYAVFRFNDVFHEFSQQNLTPSPHPILSALGYGLLLIVAIPALLRAVRKFEADGDQFMLIWLITNILILYAPAFPLQRRLFIGLIIPIVYFAVRALEDYWIDRISEKWRAPALIALAVFILPTHFLTFAAPLAFSVFDQKAGASTSLLVHQDYIAAFDWLEDNGQDNEVILAAPSVSLWIPARTHLRPVYGHELETVPAEIRLEQVRAFYRGEDCESLWIQDLPFRVNYVVWGDQENEVGLVDVTDDNIQETLTQFEVNTIEELEGRRLLTADDCKSWLAEQAVETRQFGAVTVYTMQGN